MTGPPDSHHPSKTDRSEKTKALIAIAIKGLGWAVRIFDICDRHGWLSTLASFLTNL